MLQLEAIVLRWKADVCRSAIDSIICIHRPVV